MALLTDDADYGVGETFGNAPNQWPDAGIHEYYGIRHRIRYVPRACLGGSSLPDPIGPHQSGLGCRSDKPGQQPTQPSPTSKFASQPSRHAGAPLLCLSAGACSALSPASARPAPFRLTPQLAGLVLPPGGPAAVGGGPLAGALVTGGMAVTRRRHQVAGLMRTLVRDDFVLWHRGRQSAGLAELLRLLHSDTVASKSILPLFV
ncbi:unnamed protein product [Protopolystoma xenopodis]|uniref:Uncharacterized protein n=1 Tax=Protopolystoma xenopodis TaxID=117903 RepID=A0A3S4ZTV2_9PLAT|nr:unnamed protein product [Protopolystoma xenopodis]